MALETSSRPIKASILLRPADEVRVIPASHFYIKYMVFAADRAPYAHNPTRFVP
jgi:hypothetical protein